MTDDSQRPSTDLLGALPRSRPHRRSDKRAPVVAAEAPAATPTPRRLRQPPQPRGLPPTPPQRERPEPEPSHNLVSGTVRAAAELGEIGLTTGARVLRAAVSWLPGR